MISEERLLKVLREQHVSEKASFVMKKNNTIVLKTSKYMTNVEIKTAVHKLFEVEITNVCTLIIKGKKKRHRQRVGCRHTWKKAYITLGKDQSIDFVGSHT